MRTDVRTIYMSPSVRGIGAAVGIAVAAGLLGAVVLSRPTALDVSQPYHVRTGDTVWDLAAEYVGADEDVRPVVDAILTANGLGAPEALQAGQTILLPAPGLGVASG